jgi:hypothetical protein
MQIPSTDGNVAAYESIGREVERLTLAKSFLSTGGRQFLAVLICLLSAGPFAMRWSADMETAQEQAPSANDNKQE